jgi:hypothetical protein
MLGWIVLGMLGFVIFGMCVAGTMNVINRTTGSPTRHTIWRDQPRSSPPTLEITIRKEDVVGTEHPGQGPVRRGRPATR